MAKGVAGLYDGLDGFYTAVFGRRVHHGLWADGVQTLAMALRAMEREVEGFAELRPGMRVCDVGCGYGLLAAEWQAAGMVVTGVTNSPKQADFLRRSGVPCHEGDWMERAAGGAFDRVLAMESLEHFADPAGALRLMAESLAAGGKVVLACWTVRESVFPVAGILRRTGKLHGLCGMEVLRGHIAAAGLKIEAERELTPWVGRTWTCLPRETLRVARRDGDFLRWLPARPWARVEPALGVAAAALAYGGRLARYHLLRCEFSG